MDQMQMAVMACAGALVVIALAVPVVGSKINASIRLLLEKQPALAAAPQAQPMASAAPQQALNLNGVDEGTAAMLMAITADKLGVSPGELRFISIKEC